MSVVGTWRRLYREDLDWSAAAMVVALVFQILAGCLSVFSFFIFFFIGGTVFALHIHDYRSCIQTIRYCTYTGAYREL
jgi:hypothetical protein